MTKNLLLSASVFLFAGSAIAKPPPAPKATPAPSASPRSATAADSGSSSASWLSWMLEQNGALTAIEVPWATLAQGIAGRTITPFTRTDPVDAGVAERIGVALDGLLPKLNRPDGDMRKASHPSQIRPLVETELQTALSSIAGLTCEVADAADLSTLNGSGSSAYPAFQLTEQASHRVYYLGIAFRANEKPDPTAPLLQIDPKSAAARLTADGASLLVVFDLNGKTGQQFALLNWELVDASQMKIRVQTAFRALTGEVLLPGAMLGDGRRGRD